MSQTIRSEEANLELASAERDAAWRLSAHDLAAVPSAEAHNRLGFGILLASFRRDGHFPEHPAAIPEASIAGIAEQLGVPASLWKQYAWGSRTWRRHRREIRTLTEWLGTTAVGAERNPESLTARLRERCQSLGLEPPTGERIQRIVRSAVHQYEQRLFARLHSRLAPEVCARLDALLHPSPEEEAAEHPENSTRAVLNQLRADAGRPSVRSVQDELAKLALIRSLELPADLFHDVSHLEVLVFTGRGKERTETEYRDLLASAGLQLTRVVPTASVVSVIEARRA